MVWFALVTTVLGTAFLIVRRKRKARALASEAANVASEMAEVASDAATSDAGEPEPIAKAS